MLGAGDTPTFQISGTNLIHPSFEPAAKNTSLQHLPGRVPNNAKKLRDILEEKSKRSVYATILSNK
jgi:hypothetical protein